MANWAGKWDWDKMDVLWLSWDEELFLKLCKILTIKYGLIGSYAEENKERLGYIPHRLEFIVPKDTDRHQVVALLRKSHRIDWYEFDTATDGVKMIDILTIWPYPRQMLE